MFILAQIQMLIACGDKQANLSHAAELIAKAAGSGADLILLPEAMNLGWTSPRARLDADSIPEGETPKMLIEAARKYELYICSGLVEKAGDQVFNSAILISPEGNIILKHRKLNELDIGHEFYDQGDRLNVCDTELGRLGLMICSDAFANDKVLSQALGYMGADVILSPNSWAVPADYDNSKEPCGKLWFDHYHSVAEKFALWIAGVSNVGLITAGPWVGKHCIGNSLVIGPNGELANEGPFGVDAESILYTRVKPVARPARGCSWESYWDEKNFSN